MNQLRARRRASAVITAALALAVAVAMLPRARILHGLTRTQISSPTHISHSKQHEHTGFAAYAARIWMQPHLRESGLPGIFVPLRLIRIPDPRLVRGPPLALLVSDRTI
jgi:hypothetical protein